MEKIDTDYKQRNWKIYAELFKPFNRDCAVCGFIFIFIYYIDISQKITGKSTMFCFELSALDFWRI